MSDFGCNLRLRSASVSIERGLNGRINDCAMLKVLWLKHNLKSSSLDLFALQYGWAIIALFIF